MVNSEHNSRLERLSSVIDESCSDQELEAMLADWDEATMTTHWDEFHLIGDLMRSSDMASVAHVNCVAAVSAAIANEPTPIAVKPLKAEPVYLSSLPTYQAKNWRRQAANWMSAAAAIGFVSWTISTVNQNEGVNLAASSFVRPVAQAQTVAAPAPAEWQELLQYHQAAMSSQMSPIVRANMNSVNVVVEPDRAAQAANDDSMEWIRLWEQPEVAAGQSNRQH